MMAAAARTPAAGALAAAEFWLPEEPEAVEEAEEAEPEAEPEEEAELEDPEEPEEEESDLLESGSDSLGSLLPMVSRPDS